MVFPLTATRRTAVLICVQGSLVLITMLLVLAGARVPLAVNWLLGIAMVAIAVIGGVLLLRGAMLPSRRFDDEPEHLRRFYESLYRIKPWNRVALYVFVVLLSAQAGFLLAAYFRELEFNRLTGIGFVASAAFLGRWFWLVLEHAVNEERYVGAE